MKDKTSPEKKLPLAAKIVASVCSVIGVAALLAASSKKGSTDNFDEPVDDACRTNEEAYRAFLRNGSKGYSGPVPGVCRACGGDYPHCAWGCSQFDD